MGRRGVALIFSLLVVLVLSVLSVSFFFKSITEHNLVKRYTNSTRAFWLAETGIAEAINHIPSNVSGNLGNSNYTYSAVTSPLSAQYYNVESTGTVLLPDGQSITRGLKAVIKTNPTNPGKFQHALRTTVDLTIHGNVNITGPVEEHAALNFPDLFNYAKEDIKSSATNLYTDPPNNITPVNGITWVELSPGGELRISSSGWQGSGVLIVCGDTQITGGKFDGIIYVIGKLRMSGNPEIKGTVLVESDTEVVEDTTVTGRVNITYDVTTITNALVPLQFISAKVVSWREDQ